jgi:hypothetical protein
MTRQTQHEAKPLWWNALALGLVVLAGGLCLAMPFGSDQALFTLYGRQLAHGAVLYRDLFDIKQPGIFLFYTSGGVLFGFTEVGIHLFELAYWFAFSLFALVALRPYFTTRWGAPLVPVFTVVSYYLYGELPDLTQIEILVAFPILVAWWLIDQAHPGTRTGVRRYAAAGLAAAAVVLLKHLYILIILAFLWYAVRRSWRRGIPIADIRRALGTFLIALVVPLLVVVAYFAAYGQLGRIWWVYFDFLPNSQLAGTKSFSDLKFGARRFMIGHAPILILAVLGCVRALRQRTRPRLDLVAGIALWGASGAVAFSIQGWWQYKWLIFTFPFGILAVIGIEVLVTMWGSLATGPRLGGLAAGTMLAIVSFVIGAPSPQVQTQFLWSVVIGICAGIGAELLAPRARVEQGILYVLSAALAVSVGLTAIVPIHRFRVLMEHDFGLTAEARADFQRSLSSDYRAADEDLQVLRSGHVLPGPLHVFGDPLLLVRANSPPAIPFLGQSLYSYDRRAWREMDCDLRSSLPPYIIIDAYSESIIRSRNPAIMELVDSRYKIAFVGASGTWYMRR